MQQEIYSTAFVKTLFDRMSKTYERMNYITSFGFSEKWRIDCIENANLKQGDCVADLMTGMGECWKPILKRIGNHGKIIALDFSEGMLVYATKRKTKYPSAAIEVLHQDVFNNTIQSNSVDCVISGFGLKTFSEAQLHQLAKEIKRILKLNGRFSLIDISVPNSVILKYFYLLYLKKIIPVLGKLFLGNPENYKLLGIYTEQFQNSKTCSAIFLSNGLQVQYETYFFGCASGIKGTKI